MYGTQFLGNCVTAKSRSVSPALAAADALNPADVNSTRMAWKAGKPAAVEYHRRPPTNSCPRTFPRGHPASHVGPGGRAGGGGQSDGTRPSQLPTQHHVWGEGARVCLRLYLGGRCGAAFALAHGGRRLISILLLGGG